MDQTKEPKKSSIAGIPYVVILFLAVSTIPSLVSDVITRNSVNDLRSQVAKVESKGVAGVAAMPSPTFVPTATPSASVTAPFEKGTVAPFRVSPTVGR